YKVKDPEGGWIAVHNSSNPSFVGTLNGTVLFAATDGNTGRELWSTDGTATGTRLVKDITKGSANSNPVAGAVLNGFLYFGAGGGRECWKSDGTAAGTVRVRDIYPGSGSSDAGDLANVNGLLYFAANDGSNGNELWQSDGTSAGTVMVQDIYPGSTGSDPAWL